MRSNPPTPRFSCGGAALVVRQPQRLVARHRIVDQAVDRPVVRRMTQVEELRSLLAVRQRDVDDRRVEAVAALDRQRERALSLDQRAADVALDTPLPLRSLFGDERVARAQRSVAQPRA